MKNITVLGEHVHDEMNDYFEFCSGDGKRAVTTLYENFELFLRFNFRDCFFTISNKQPKNFSNEKNIFLTFVKQDIKDSKYCGVVGYEYKTKDNGKIYFCKDVFEKFFGDEIVNVLYFKKLKP